MDHEEYVAARHGRLVEHALELGCSEEQAADQVARVLEEQRTHIARADDPDPGVRAALARRISGEAEPRGTVWIYVSVAAVVALVAAGALLWRPPEPPTVPSLFGYDDVAATRVLEEVGFEVVEEGAEACEPRGLVLGSDPSPGETAERGATITLRTAIPADPGCLATYGFRSDAWAFVRFARGGRAPEFASSVSVFVDGDPVGLLTAGAAAGRAAWAETLGSIEQAATQPAPTRSAMPRLVVDSLVPPPRLCGVPVPADYADRLALRLSIDPSPDGADSLCPFTVDLYRDAQTRVEAVSLYTGRSRDVSD